MLSCVRRASSPFGGRSNAYRKLSISVDFPAPRPPTSTLRLSLNRSHWPSRSPPAHETAMSSVCALGFGSLLRRMRDSQSRNACLRPSMDGDTIFIHVVALGSESVAGALTSLALTTARERGRICAGSLLAIMSRHASGAPPLEPGNAIASRSGQDQTRARACPFNVMRRPPELHACAAMVIPPILGMD